VITLVVGRTWDGQLLSEAERAQVRLGYEGDDLRIEVDAPFEGDAPPLGPPGPIDGLWAHEVVELFVVGPDEQYTEIELSPHGHHLVIQLEGVRQRKAALLPIRYEASVEGNRWKGVALVPKVYLPASPRKCNAYRISGAQGARRYHAMVPVPGERPDFHRLERFAPWVL
jgi:hypothetical protein